MRKKHLWLLAAALLILSSCSKNKGDTWNPTSEADLSGHTFVTIAGSYYDSKYSSQEGLTAFLVNSDADAIQAVVGGNADVLITDEVSVNAEVQKRMGLRKAFSSTEAFPCAIAFPKGDDELLPAFNEFLSMMRTDGTLDAYVRYWMEGGEPVPYPEPSPIRDSSPIRQMTGITVAPISYLENGEWTGLDVDIVRRFAAWYGRPLEVTPIALASAIVALQTGQADMVTANLFITEERKERVSFSEPYFYCHPGFFVRDTGSIKEGTFLSRTKDSFTRSFLVEKRWKLITDGLLVTIIITLLSILLGTVLGVGVCALSMSRRKWARSIAGAYDFLMQGIPMVVLLLIMFYVVFAGSGVSALWVAVITFALNFASSAGGVFRQSVGAVPRGQWEAGYALGFTGAQTFRGIIFPQALRSGLPPFTGHCVSLLKGTSIVGFIAVQDLTRASDLLRSRTFEAFMPLLIITVLYFLLAWVIRALLNLALPVKRHD